MTKWELNKFVIHIMHNQERCTKELCFEEIKTKDTIFSSPHVAEILSINLSRNSWA